MRLEYTLTGPRKGAVILLLHGFMGSAADWNGVTAELSGSYCCLAVDLPGHGKTAPHNREHFWGMEETAASVINLLQELNIPKCILAGYSLGGRLALYLTLRHPQYFHKVILESASPGLKTAGERQTRILHDESLAERLQEDFAAFLHSWYQLPLFKSLTESDSFEEVLIRRRQNDPAALAKSLREIGSGRQPSLWRELAENKIPLLLLVGKKDVKFVALAKEMAASCSNAKVVVVANCGHSIHAEMPQAFVKQVIQFLSY